MVYVVDNGRGTQSLKSGSWQPAFDVMMINLGKVCIQLFSFQL